MLGMMHETRGPLPYLSSKEVRYRLALIVRFTSCSACGRLRTPHQNCKRDISASV